MKKNIKAVIACVAALAVAGGGYALLRLTDDSSSQDSSSQAQTDPASVPTPLLSFEKADITSISVENLNGSFEAVPEGEPAEDGTVTFTIKGLEDLDINYTLTSSLLNNSSTLTSDSTAVENADDLEKYGLKSPQAKVTVKAGTETKTILVGNESPVSGETYCMEEGGNTVYLVGTSSVSVFANSDTAFISTTILEEPAEDEAPTVDKISIKRSDLDYDIVLEYDKTTDEDGTTSGTLATHYMSEPIFAYLDVEKSQDATHGLFGLTAHSVLAAHPDDNTKKASGFDDPLCTVTMNTSDGKTHTLTVGKELEIDDGKYYVAMFDDTDVIYAIDEESVCWASLKPEDIMSKMVFGTMVWDIGKLEINVADGESVTFEGSGTSADDYKVTKNGKSCEAKRFQSFYQFLLKTSAEDFVIDEQPQGDPIVSVYLETQDGKTKQTVEFYESEGKKVLISVNGTPCFKCRSAYVDLLIKNLSKFDSSEEFVMNW
ncbi:DUF4340 domain-containing protein [Porcipelethomonas sp.]|uniref:DUF4340 domain-containing protein n=1 Tax=Porcipelethomonas sp. TaxID=2981675 RepID=UPI003EF496B1